MEAPGTTPGTTGGQAATPSSGTTTPAPSTSQPSGQPTGQPEGGDPFEFGGSAPAGKPGQGTTTTPTGQDNSGEAAPGQVPPPPPAGQPEPGVKDYLKEEFGGDTIKLNKAYSSLVPKFTQVSQQLSETKQNYSTVLQIMKQLDQSCGPEIRQLLIKKGLVQPTPEELAAGQNPGNPPGTPPPPAGAPPQGPKPVTAEDVKRIMAEDAQAREEFDASLADFKTRNPDWADFKAELQKIRDDRPDLFHAAATNQIPLDYLLNMAKGMAYPRVMESVKKGALQAGLHGKQQRTDAHMETPSQGQAGGGDYDPWNMSPT